MEIFFEIEPFYTSLPWKIGVSHCAKASPSVAAAAAPDTAIAVVASAVGVRGVVGGESSRRKESASSADGTPSNACKIGKM